MCQMSRRAFSASAVLLLAAPARADTPPPRIDFNPALGVEHRFQVRYTAGLAVSYRLSVTAVAREGDRLRLRLLVSHVEWPGGSGMDMVVAAALMLDGLPFEMFVNARGSREVADWPNLARTLRERAMNLPMGQGVALSVIGTHTAEQVSWHLSRALDPMGFARSYLSFAQRTGASTIDWYGTPIDVTIQPTAAGGATIAWRTRSGGSGEVELRPDGLASRAAATFADLGRQSFAVEALPAPGKSAP